MSHDADLRERLERDAARLPGPRFTFDDVVRAGRRRRTRTRVVRASSALALGLVGLAAIVLTRGPEPAATDPTPEIMQPAWGASPVADVSGLGPETRLLPFDPPSGDLDRIRGDLDVVAGVPILAIGQVEGTSARVYRAFGHLEPGVNPAGDRWDHTGTAWCEWLFDDAGVVGPSCMPDIPGVTVASIVGARRDVQVWVGLSDDVAFVVHEEDGSVTWQRPRGGVAALPGLGHVEAFDRFGVPLGTETEFARDPMPPGAEPVADAALPTPDLEGLADLVPGDALYHIPVGDHIVFVRVRSPRGPDGRLHIEPPLLFATSCDVAQSVPLPRRWRGGCLERTVAGERVVGTFLYGTDLPFGGWTDDGWGEATGPPMGAES
jgi:hypothetical protein